MITPLNDGVITQTPNNMTPLSYYRLFLKSDYANTPWIPWVEIKPSVLDGAGLGVFAVREFRKGQEIGWYYGRKKTQKRVNNRSRYQLSDLDAEGGLGKPGRLGMHFINDPSLVSSGAADLKRKSKLWNVEFHCDYSVRAKRQIRPGDELYADYNFDKS
jgi:hypothetical protein